MTDGNEDSTSPKSIATAKRSLIGEIGDVVVLPATRPGHAASMGLAKVSERGILQAIQVTVNLDAKRKHVYKIMGSTVISAAGYFHINKVMGVNLHLPETFIGEGGSVHSNPFVEMDQAGAPTRITVRVLALGINAVGNWQLITSTLVLDAKSILAEDAMAKWRGKSGDQPTSLARSWGELMSAENVPDDVSGDPHKKCIAVSGGYTLVVDLANTDVLDIIQAHQFRIKMLGRLAETIAKRRILQAWTGAQNVDEDAPSVTVVAWRLADHATHGHFRDLFDRLQAGDLQIDGKVVDAKSDNATIDNPDDVDPEMAAADDEFDDSPQEARHGVARASKTRDCGLSADQLEAIATRKARIHVLARELPYQIFLKCVTEAELSGQEELQQTGDLRLLDHVISNLEIAVARRKEQEQTIGVEAQDRALGENADPPRGDLPEPPAPPPSPPGEHEANDQGPF